MANSIANSGALRAAQHDFTQGGSSGAQSAALGEAPAHPRAYTERPPAVPPNPAFATAATARLFDALGWPVAMSSRRDTVYHKPMRCCFVLDGGAHQEAAFGYTGVTAPLDGENPALAAAQIRVERFLHHLGEDSGILVQNTPLIAFGGPRRDRLVVFGGWRFHDRFWRPFVLSPDGLGGVSVQTTFFEAQTAPHHLAEIFGVPADKALPRVTEVVSAIAACPGPDERAEGPETTETPGTPATGPRLAVGLRIVPFADGWSIAQPGAAAALTQLPLKSGPIKDPATLKPLVLEPKDRRSDPATSTKRRAGPLNPLAPNGLPWDLGEDEFRFHHNRPLDRA